MGNERGSFAATSSSKNEAKTATPQNVETLERREEDGEMVLDSAKN